MKTKLLVLPALAVGAAAMLLLPRESEGFSTIGGLLAQGQRDFAVFNNFTDPQANNNTNPHVNFPGYTGAVMAIWKGCIEWQSELHGNGQGDPHQGNLLGSGGANFDPMFVGEATGVGGTDSNIHSELSGSNGSTFAFTETPISNGWRIRYYSVWTWQDGPTNQGAADLQGISAHEYGHALGLGHTGVPGATMQPGTATGIEQRSIAADDIAGVQSIYGAKIGTKPRITALSVNAGVATITGVNFNPTNGNNVWFTPGSGTGTGPGGTIVVSNLGTTGGNGTEIVVGIPAIAGPGDVIVRTGSGNAGLSNAWPIDPAGGGPGGGITISSITPTSIDAVTVDGPAQVSIFGSGFLDTTGVDVDGVPLNNFPADFAVLSDSQINITNWPLVSKLGAVDITVNGTTGSDTTQITVTENSPPAFNLVGSQSEGGFLFTATGLQFQCASGPGDAHFVAFSGQNTPSILPGFVSYDIGNNFFNLFNLGTYSIPASGYADVNLAVSGNLSGLIIYLQSAVLDVSTGQVFPLVMTNTQSGQFLF